MEHRLARLAALLIVLAAGCSSEPDMHPTPEPCEGDMAAQGGLPLLGADCDPLVPTQCGFPFPSNVWLQDDPTTVTGKHVVFGQTTLPEPSKGTPIDPLLLAGNDGFSPGQVILTHLPGAVVAGLPTQDDLASSLGADSPTVLLDAETGERVPHFAELDRGLTDELDEDRTFMIRPVVRLKDATRYIVAIRRVIDKDGKAIEPSPAFKALRDGGTLCDPAVTRRRDLYADIFARLEKAGVAKGDLQSAWDYTTASRENNTRWLLHMRDDALAKVGADGPEYTIVKVEEKPNPFILRRILAKMKVPLYLDKPGPGGKLVFGDDGLPKQNGTAEYEVLIHVPNKAETGGPLPLVQNGHGLLGAKTEGQDGYLAEFADGFGYVAFSVDFVGMAKEDFSIITESLVSDVNQFRSVVERQHQGLINSLLAMRLLSGRFVNEPLVQINGKSAIDPTQRFYRGDSQGGIFGTTYMSISTDVTRGLLGEPGLPYNLLLNRSADFGFYFILVRGAYQTGRNIQLLLGLIQALWDRTEPDGYVPYLTKDPLPGTPAHDVLLHVALGDYQVTPLGAHIIARSVGAKNLKPVNRSVFGIEEASGPLTGSAMVEYSFGLPEAPKTNTPPEGPAEDDPHDKVRKLLPSYQQVDHFFRTGEVAPYCEGVCDPL